MQRARSLPQTAREWSDVRQIPRESLSSDCASDQQQMPTTPSNAYQALITTFLAVANSCSPNHSEQNEWIDDVDGSACSVVSKQSINSFAAGQTSSVRDDPNHDTTIPSYAAWLAVVFPAKENAFVWRFCVLRGDSLMIFLDENLANPTLLSVHSLVYVERLHFINRGLCIFDRTKQQVWLHTDSDTDSFETWLVLFRQAILHQASPPQEMLPPHDHQDSADTDALQLTNLVTTQDTDIPITGWFLVRRIYIRNWLFGRTRSMYVTICGRVFASFRVNVEGKWADLQGEINSFRARANSLEILFDNDHVLQLCGHKKRPIEKKWFVYLEQACHHHPRSNAAPLRLPTALMTNNEIEL